MKTEPLIVGARELAEILDITDRRVRQYVSEGTFEKEGHGRYDLKKVVRAYVQYQIDLQKAKQSIGSKADEETRLLKEKADAQAMENEKTRGDNISLSLCSLTWKTWVKSFSAQMLGVAPMLKAECPHIEDQDILKLDETIRQRLTELSKDGIPPELQKRVDIYAGDAEASSDDNGE